MRYPSLALGTDEKNVINATLHAELKEDTVCCIAQEEWIRIA